MSLTDEIEAQLFRLFRKHHAIHVSTLDGDLVVDRAVTGILSLLADCGQLKLRDIAQAFGLDPSTITRQVQSAERDGLLERLPDPGDGRVSLIRLTPLGTRVLEAVRERRRSALDSVMSTWATTERADLARSLTRLNDAMTLWLETPDPVPSASPEPDLRE